MAVFQFEAGGKTFELEAPNAQAAADAFKRTQGVGRGPGDPTGASATIKLTQAEDIALSASSGIKRGLAGLAGIPGDAAEWGARGIDRASRFVGDVIGADVKPREDRPATFGSADILGAAEKYLGPLHEPQTTAGKYARTGGDFASGLAMGPGGLIRRAITQVALPAAASEAAGQATEGTAAEPYARVAGAIGGGVGPSILARAITPLPATPAHQRLVDILNSEGVTSLTAGQRTGSTKLGYAESALGDALGAGGGASAITRRGQEQFTEAAMRRAGGGANAAPETLAANQRRLGQQFEDLSARNTLVMDGQFVRDLNSSTRLYDRVPPSQQKAIVQGYVDDIIQHAQLGGTMPGAFYQEMRSRLSKQSNGVKATDPTLSDTLGELRDALDRTMGRSISPADRAAWETARREYAAQKVIERTASRAGQATAEGQIVPSNLRNTVAAENNGMYARGEGQFSELARAGSGVMAPLPQSGTAPRAAIHTIASLIGAGVGGVGGGGVGSGLGAAAGAVAGPAVAGRLLTSRIAQGYLGNQRLARANLSPGQAAVVDALMAIEQQRLTAPR